MKKILCLGEVLMRLSTTHHLRFNQSTAFNANIGGAELNVASSLAAFGLTSAFISKVPDNEIGEMALFEMKKNAVSAQHVAKGGKRLGLYYLEEGAAHRPSNVVYDRAHSAMCEAVVADWDWDEVFQDAGWLHLSGVTAGISADAAQICLHAAQLAQKRNIKISCDINYRGKLWKYGKTSREVMPELLSYANIVFGNHKDASLLFDIDFQTEGQSYEEASLKMYEQFAAQLPNAEVFLSTKRTVIDANQNRLFGQLFDGKHLLTTT
ncbi:MAG: sugar kinase, partial [Bacteroidota bacterium]